MKRRWDEQEQLEGLLSAGGDAASTPVGLPRRRSLPFLPVGCSSACGREQAAFKSSQLYCHVCQTWLTYSKVQFQSSLTWHQPQGRNRPAND